MAANLEDHDLVYGIVLPNLQDKYDSDRSKKEEFTLAQARQIDFTGLPAYMNHNRNLPPIGTTIAYRVRDDTDEPHAEAILKLNSASNFTKHNAMQRNLMMEGGHASLSGGHVYYTDYVTNAGVYAASLTGDASAVRTTDPYGDPGVVVNKRIEEISLCDLGKRPGSRVLEYMPCRRSLEVSYDDAIRSFTQNYNYTPPPAGMTKDSNGWKAYIDTLAREVRERRQRVLTDRGYMDLLGSSGTHAASGDRTNKKYLKEIPWVFMSHLESQGFARFDPFKSLGAEIERDKQNLINMAEAGKPTQPIGQPPPSTQSNATSSSSNTAGAQTPATPAGTSADGGNKATETGAKRTVQEVLPNADSAPGDARVNALEIIQQQKAALLSEAEKNKSLLERLAKLEDDNKQRAEQETQKRKRDDEEEHKAKKNKFVSNTNAYFEDINRNLGNPKVKAMSEEMRRELLAEIAASTSASQLDNIAKTYSKQLEFVHAASADAKVQRDAQEQAELRQHQAFLQNYMSQPPATSLAMSGGQPATVVGTDLKREPAPAAATTTTQFPDSGTVLASRRNPFGDIVNPFAGRTTVSEIVPDNKAGASTTIGGSAKAEIDPNDLSSVIDDHVARTGQFPSEAVLRHGGVKEVTRVVASADGGTRQETGLVARRAAPYQGPITMKEFNKAYFDSFVADLNKQIKTGQRDAQFLADAQKWGEKNDAGKFKYMLPYTGPTIEDKIVSTGLTTLF